MATRYSPGVLPNAGPRARFDPETIARALDNLQRERELKVDRQRAEEDRTRRIEREDAEFDAFKEDRTYQQEIRERDSARQDVADVESGILTRDQFRQQLDPIAARTQELINSVRNPTLAAMPTRSRILDQINQQRAEDALAQVRGATPVSGGRVYVPEMSAGARQQRIEEERLRQQGDAASRVAAAMEADPALAEFYRLNPGALSAFLDHNFTMKREGARDAANMERVRYQQQQQNARAAADRASRERTSGGGAGNERGFGGITWDQAMDNARALLAEMSQDGGEIDPQAVFDLATDIFYGEYVPPEEPVEPPEGPGFGERLGAGLRRLFGRTRTIDVDRQEWDRMAEEAYELGLDPEEAIGYPRP